jgi:replicative DNA helicase
VREKKIKFIVIDYLQLIHTKNSKGNTNDDISKITIALKNLAKELNVPIICLSQLSREVEKRADKKPQLSDLRDSGAIEQDADMVIFIYRPEYYGIMDDGLGNSTIGKAQIIVSKHRNGATDDLIVNFDGRCTNFYDSRY